MSINLKFRLCLIFCVISTIGFSQQVDFDTLIIPIENKTSNFHDYLISLAWINNPDNSKFDHNIRIANDNIKIARKEWANDIGLTFNLNESNLKTGSDSLGLNNFPRYNFGLTFNLGRLITLPQKVNVAREELEIEKASLDQRKLAIRAEVLRRYQTYLQAFEIYKIRKKAEQDASEIFELMRSRFREGTVDFEEFSRASANLQNAAEGVLDAQGSIDLSRLDLEEIIGIPLNEAQGFFDQ